MDVTNFTAKSYRQSLFELLQCYGEQIWERNPPRSTRFCPFFADIFACQNHPTKGDPIAFDNLTEQEKEYIKDYLPTFLNKIVIHDFSIMKTLEREFLSGLVIFRIDILSTFQEVFDNDLRIDLTQVNRCLNYWEQYFKEAILAGYKEGNFKSINGRFINVITEEVRASHKWWNDDYHEHDDCIDSLAEEYSLTD